jgi:hypothetical protein
LETLKDHYKHELVPLTQTRETLTREIAELKAVRDVFLEETTVLNARNEELAQLSAVYSRRVESAPDRATHIPDTLRPSVGKTRTPTHQLQQSRQSIGLPPSVSSSTSGTSTIYEDPNADPRYHRVQRADAEMHTPSKGKFIKWPGSRAKEASTVQTLSERKMHLEHNFQQLSILRFTRCDHCGDKMWGSQLRCTGEDLSSHHRKNTNPIFSQLVIHQYMYDALVTCLYHVRSTNQLAGELNLQPFHVSRDGDVLQCSVAQHILLSSVHVWP